MLAFIKHLFRLQFLIIVVAIFCGIYYPDILERLKNASLEYLGEWINTSENPIEVKYSNNVDKKCDEKIFTKSELAKYNGENGMPLYLALLGSVYDVTKGSKHYGIGCSYNYFVGRDASVSFITGEFEHFDEASADDVNKLKPAELLSLENWSNFYAKDYTYKGKLIGRFYDETGTKTKYFHEFDALLDVAKISKAADEKLRDDYPDCNIEWSHETGTKVWCTKSSGGKERSWTGYPRKLFQLGGKSFRCACVREEDLTKTEVMIKPYENCDSLSDTCYYKVD